MNVRDRLLPVFTTLAKAGFLGAAGFALWSALTPTDGDSSLFFWDKLAHFVAFYVVTLLALPAFPRTRLVVIAAGLTVLGVAIEFLQMLPAVNRDSDVKDVVADAAGIAAALAPVLAWRLRDLGARPAPATGAATVVDLPPREHGPEGAAVRDEAPTKVRGRA